MFEIEIHMGIYIEEYNEKQKKNRLRWSEIDGERSII